MKFPKIRLLRPEIEVEFIRPIVGRLYLIFKLPALCKVINQKVCINITGKFCNVDCGKVYFKTIHYICIPNIKIKKAKKNNEKKFVQRKA